MFKVLLLDLDGVLRIWDPDLTGAVELAHGLPAGTLSVAAFAPHRLQPALTGAVDDEAWRDSVAEAIAAEHGEAAHAAVARMDGAHGHGRSSGSRHRAACPLATARRGLHQRDEPTRGRHRPSSASPTRSTG